MSAQASAAGAAVGALFGLGLLVVLARVPRLRRVDLDARLAPYLREVPRSSRLLAVSGSVPAPLRALEALLGPLAADLQRAGGRWLERLGSGRPQLQRRLQQAGRTSSVEQFRAEQLVWGALGTLAGVLAAAVLAARDGAALLPGVALVVVGGLLGVMARDLELSRALRRREERMLAEFPTVAELLALSVGAGEGAVGALERVAASSSGELAGELRLTLADARAGASLVQALEGLARRTSLASLSRFVDGVVVAVECATVSGPHERRCQRGDLRSRRQPCGRQEQTGRRRHAHYI